MSGDAEAANALMHELIRAINARVRAPLAAQNEYCIREQAARLRYEAALSAWLGGEVKA